MHMQTHNYTVNLYVYLLGNLVYGRTYSLRGMCPYWLFSCDTIYWHTCMSPLGNFQQISCKAQTGMYIWALHLQYAHACMCDSWGLSPYCVIV